MIDNFDNTIREILDAAGRYSFAGNDAGALANFYGRIGALVRAHDERREGDRRAFVRIADIILGPYPSLHDVARVVNTATPAWRESLCATPISDHAHADARVAFAAYATWRCALVLAAERGERIAPPSWSALITAALEGWREGDAYRAAAHYRTGLTHPGVPRYTTDIGAVTCTVTAGSPVVEVDSSAVAALGADGKWTIVPNNPGSAVGLDAERGEAAIEALRSLLG